MAFFILIFLLELCKRYIHAKHRNRRKLKHTLGIKILKECLGLNYLSVETMAEFFAYHENETSDLRSSLHLANRNMHTTNFDTDAITNLTPKIRENIPD